MEPYIPLICTSLVVVTAGIVLIVWLTRPHEKVDRLVQADILKAHVASLILPLPDEVKEAIDLYAWATKTSWRYVAQNVALGKDHPYAKEALNVPGSD